jgi:hypothetical protein
MLKYVTINYKVHAWILHASMTTLGFARISNTLSKMFPFNQ